MPVSRRRAQAKQGKASRWLPREVRELAQRSATAAKDIKGLINKSGDEVKSGVALVRETGEALGLIARHVSDINDQINSIATAAREQATGLGEINSAVNQMDQVTQQNAAMVEETTAVTHRLSGGRRRSTALSASSRCREPEGGRLGPGRQQPADPDAHPSRRRPSCRLARERHHIPVAAGSVNPPAP